MDQCASDLLGENVEGPSNAAQWDASKFIQCAVGSVEVRTTPKPAVLRGSLQFVIRLPFKLTEKASVCIRGVGRPHNDMRCFLTKTTSSKGASIADRALYGMFCAAMGSTWGLQIRRQRSGDEGHTVCTSHRRYCSYCTRRTTNPGYVVHRELPGCVVDYALGVSKPPTMRSTPIHKAYQSDEK